MWKAVDTCPFALDSVPDQYKTQEMCDRVVSKKSFMLKYCLDRYKIQEMCDKDVDSYFWVLKFVSDWIATSKMIKKHDNTSLIKILWWL